LIVLFFGLVVLAAGTLGAELFLSRFSLLLTIAGLVVVTFGWNYMRAIFFPWIFLLFMIPIPPSSLNQITFPLQLLASKTAAVTLPLAGVPVLREGNIIQLPAMALEVAEACSGISFPDVACDLGHHLRILARTPHLDPHSPGIRLHPIAVLANSLRNYRHGFAGAVLGPR